MCVYCCVIRSWGDQATKDVWDGLNTRAARSIPRTVWPAVAAKLELVDAAVVLGDLAAPPGNRLEALKGDRRGVYSIRVNRQFRITFRFRDGDAYGVRCEDYH